MTKSNLLEIARLRGIREVIVLIAAVFFLEMFMSIFGWEHPFSPQLSETTMDGITGVIFATLAFSISYKMKKLSSRNQSGNSP